MKLLLAYCGLDCNTCPVHLATIEQDENRRKKMRISIAGQCSRLYKKTFLPEQITDCGGCRSAPGRLLVGCLGCAIRNCAIERKLQNCAYCSDYACEALTRHLEYDKSAKDRLEAIRNRNQ